MLALTLLAFLLVVVLAWSLSEPGVTFPYNDYRYHRLPNRIADDLVTIVQRKLVRAYLRYVFRLPRVHHTPGRYGHTSLVLPLVAFVYSPAGDNPLANPATIRISLIAGRGYLLGWSWEFRCAPYRVFGRHTTAWGVEQWGYRTYWFLPSQVRATATQDYLVRRAWDLTPVAFR